MSTNVFQAELISDTIGPQVMIIRFCGELDSSCIGELSKCIEEAMQGEKRNFIIADMTGVTVLCSAALGEFMGNRKRLAENGGDLVFAGINRDLKQKLTLMGANKIFSFFSDIRSAASAYKWHFQKKAETVTLTFPSSLQMVPPVRQMASRLARKKGYGTRDAFRIETIVDEVCNNAVEHGKEGSDNEIKIILTMDKEKFDINVINISDPEKIASLKSFLDQAESKKHTGADQKRGRGLALIRMLSNKMSVECSEDGTNVRVTKIREE
ncbi:ATP-binding protein [Chitinispirillales bacterium ANBcel5]|uniref:ATP-binding protein n=1 Tax=Cellulosispirillum alkaliphilum TaxID=3039283 RepID=UPI002A582488|nr:ATP-binding protein [Chitinispirillales bacterium ANBcel5]